MKKCCRTCVYNRPRYVNQKTCLKNHRAVFGYDCKDWEGGELDGKKILQQSCKQSSSEV